MSQNRSKHVVCVHCRQTCALPFLSLFVSLFLCIDPPVSCDDLLLILSLVPLAISFFSCYITFFISFFYFSSLLLLRYCYFSSSSLACCMFDCWLSFAPSTGKFFLHFHFMFSASFLIPMLYTSVQASLIFYFHF